MILDQLCGRFAWYRRHRGGLWSRIPGPGGGYFHHPSTRDGRGEWVILGASLRQTYAPAWLERRIARLAARLPALRGRFPASPAAPAPQDRDSAR